MPDASLFPSDADAAMGAPTSHVGIPRWLLVWTVLALVAVAVLLRPSDPTSVDRILHLGSEVDPPSILPRIRRALLLTHLALQPVYPWILAGPYLFWLGARFPLLRGRLRVSVPIHVAAIAAALAASAGYRQSVIARRPLVLVWNVVESRRDERSLTNLPGGERTTFSTGVMILSNTTSNGDAIPRSVSNLLANPGRPPLPITGAAPPFVTHEAEIRIVTVRTNSDGAEAPLPSRNPPNPASTNASGSRPGPPTTWPAMPDIVGAAPASSLLLDLLACLALLGSSHALYFYRQSRERERRALSLEAHLARTRLHALQAQLQPHFLFNTLNSITTLLREDPRAAEEMLVSLSDLLRLALAQSSRTEIPLRDEVHFLELYLEIQRVRFGPRLRFEANLEADCLDHAIPALLLQPLVENAVRHGLEPSPDPVLIRISARREGEALVLRVEDDGVGPPSASVAPPKEGNGLGNVRARLAASHAVGAAMTYPTPAGARGFAVELRLPFSPGARSRSTSPA